MLSNIIKQLAKVRDLIGESTAIFEELSIVIFIEDFYQFLLAIGFLLWDKVCIKENHYSKMVWKNFKVVITLTQQIH